MLSKDTSGASRILSNGIIRKCIAAVYTKICIRTLGIYEELFFVFLEGLCLLPIFVSLHALYSIPIGAVFRNRRMEANTKANINLPKPNYLHTCDVSSGVHIHVIRNALEARQATALHVETTIICGVVLAFRRLSPERSRDKTKA